MPDGRKNDFRRKRQGRDDCPRSDGAVVGSERHAARKISKELAVDTFDPAHGGSRPITCGDSPAAFGVALELLRILNGVFLLHQRGAAAIFEIIDSLPAHKLVLNAAEIQPQMRKLMNEQRSSIEKFLSVDCLPPICGSPR